MKCDVTIDDDKFSPDLNLNLEYREVGMLMVRKENIRRRKVRRREKVHYHVIYFMGSDKQLMMILIGKKIKSS